MVTSVWQRDVQRILIRTSQGLGDKTTISSISSASPAFLATAAAAHFIKQVTTKFSYIDEALRVACSVPLHRIGFPEAGDAYSLSILIPEESSTLWS